MNYNNPYFNQYNRFNNNPYFNQNPPRGNFRPTTSLLKSKYDRPEKTFTDTLQNNDSMQEKLQNYERVDDIDFVPLSSHLRYVTWKNGRQRFCLGGFLMKIHPKYIMLSNNNFRWSVQRKHFDKDNKLLFETVFFKLLTKNEQSNSTIESQNEELLEQKNENKKLKNELYELKKLLKQTLQKK